MHDEILRKTFEHLFRKIRSGNVHVKKAILDIYTTIQLENLHVGSCVCHGGWGKYRKTILNEFILNKDLSIEGISAKKNIFMPNNFCRSLYAAICSAMSRRSLINLINQQNIGSSLKLNLKSDLVVQIGLVDSIFLDYRLLKKLYIFDAGLFNPSQRQRLKSTYSAIIKNNTKLEVIFVNKLATQQKILKEADVLTISGSTLTNGTLDVILDSSAKAREIVLWGRSCAIDPKMLFDRNITYIYSSIAPVDLMDLAISDYDKYISLDEPGREYIISADNYNGTYSG